MNLLMASDLLSCSYKEQNHFFETFPVYYKVKKKRMKLGSCVLLPFFFWTKTFSKKQKIGAGEKNDVHGEF